MWFCKGIEGPLLPTVDFPGLWWGSETAPAGKGALGLDTGELILVGVLPAMWSWADHRKSLKLANLLCKMLLIAKQEFQFSISTCEIKSQKCCFIHIQILLHIDIGTYTDIYKYINIYIQIYIIYTYTNIYIIYIFVFIFPNIFIHQTYIYY